MDPVIGLSLGRIGLGARLLQLDTRNNRQLPYLTRMFGSREIALGTLTLLARGAARRRLVQACIAVDGADACAGVLAGRDGSVSKGSSAMLTAPAVLAVLAGVASLRGAGVARRAAQDVSQAVGAAP
jgi:hypothetical protein